MSRRNSWIAAALCCLLLFACVSEDVEPVRTPAPTAAQQTEAAPSPTVAPSPTREPVEGDVAFDRFPTYDTGADADWSYQSDELKIAIRRYEDEEEKQVYYVADVWLRNIRSFRAGFANGAYNRGTEDAEAFSVRENAVLGVNGSYNTGLVVHDGTLYRPLDEKHEAVMALYRDGSMEALSREAFDLEAAQSKGLVHAWQFGPLLVHDGKPNEAESFGSFGIRHSRIMLGYYEPGHYVAVAVDGRRRDAIGMDANDMIELMVSLGCKEAINLDGGLSAIMTFMGKTVNDPPKANADDAASGGRNLADMLLFAAYDDGGSAPPLDTLEARTPSED